MARGARNLVPGTALGGDPGVARACRDVLHSHSLGTARRDPAAIRGIRSCWSGTTASIGSFYYTRSIFRCRVIGGSDKILVRSTRSNFQRTSLPSDQSNGIDHLKEQL